ncbi:MAG TPA: hypothetical protein VFN56_01720 [Candidatus Saccharimonadales bacterium]|nr:hypothetical protein [Candidatus Saccharimonadales bacterium]
MDSLFNLLGDKDFSIPPEAKAIKEYVRDEFHQEVEVMVREKDIVITGRGAAFINTLRLRGPTIKRAAQTDKRLVFRIL